MNCLTSFCFAVIILLKVFVSLNENGKPVEKQGRKAKGSKALASHDSLATETGFSV